MLFIAAFKLLILSWG